MKAFVMMGMTLGTLAALAITVQNAPKTTTVRSEGDTVVVNTAAPKYSLDEAIALSIRELIQRGEEVTVGAVKNRLKRMSASDVDLNVSGLSRTIREAIEAQQAVAARELPAPDPAKYEKREAFVSAYVEWKQNVLTPTQRKDLHARMGAETKFKREAKTEAGKVWDAQKEGGVK